MLQKGVIMRMKSLNIYTLNWLILKGKAIGVEWDKNLLMEPFFKPLEDFRL